MNAPPEPGGWELHRALETIQQSLARIEERMVPRPEFEAHKAETDRRLQALESTKSAAHEAIYQRIASKEAELRAEIDKVETEGDARETARQKEYRDLNIRGWVAVGGAVLAVIGGVLTAVLTASLGAG